MPDPLLYLQGIVAAFCASAGLTWIVSRRASPESFRARCGGLVPLAAGFLAGYPASNIVPRWPPANGLDRFLAIVLPAAFLTEWLASHRGMPRWIVAVLRGGLALAVGPILLRGSVYLGDSPGAWGPGTAACILGGCAVLLVVVRGLAERLADRSTGVTLPLLLALCVQSAGLAVMLAGYLKGGAAAFPVAASLAAVALVSRQTKPAPALSLRASLSVTVVALYGIVFIGRFFGGLSSWSGLVLLLAPLAPWLIEIPPFRPRSPRRIVLLQVLLTALALAIVLVPAAVDFVKRSLPLL